MLTEKQREFFRTLLLEERDKVMATSEKNLVEEVQAVRAADEVDQASLDLSQNLTFRLRDRDRKLLNKINKAILSIEDGSYGECESCGENISEKRLIARPVSNLCIDCKEKQEHSERAFVEKHA